MTMFADTETADLSPLKNALHHGSMAEVITHLLNAKPVKDIEDKFEVSRRSLFRWAGGSNMTVYDHSVFRRQVAEWVGIDLSHQDENTAVTAGESLTENRTDSVTAEAPSDHKVYSDEDADTYYSGKPLWTGYQPVKVQMEDTGVSTKGRRIVMTLLALGMIVAAVASVILSAKH